MMVTEADLDFGERTLHQLGFATRVAFGRVRPGIHFRLPLDEDLREIINFVFGFTLEVHTE